MDREARPRQERAEITKILDAADRFRQWWNDGEAKLKSRQEDGESAKGKAA